MNIFVRYLPLLLLTGAAFFPSLAAAGGAANDKAKSDKYFSTEPTTETLMAMENQAHRAYYDGDGDFFEHFFSDSLVAQKSGERLDKPTVVKIINATNCKVDDGWVLSAPDLLKVDKSAYVLTYVATTQGSCVANGKVERIPSPVRAATVWVQDGSRWQAAFHGEIPIFDFDAPAAADVPDEGSQTSANNHANEPAAEASTPADPLTYQLLAAEDAIWQAWKAHDTSAISSLTADNIAFVNLFGTFFADKATTVNDWTSAACDVTGFTLTNGTGSLISPAVAMLTVTSTIEGTCGGQDISGQKVYANTVYVRIGNAWKWAFGFNSPT